MSVLMLSVAGYAVLCYIVGLLVWRKRSNDRTGMSSLYLLASPLTVPIVVWIVLRERL